jgi:hypothetical protein
MEISELIQQRQNINSNICKCLISQLADIKVSAENMCECATDIRGQGYSTFLQSREDFICKINDLQQQLQMSANINTSHTKSV